MTPLPESTYDELARILEDEAARLAATANAEGRKRAAS